MDTSQKQIIRLAVISVLVLLSCSCTPEMKKTRALQQGESHFKAGEYDAAKIEYLKVLRLDPGNAVAYARCGAMWAAEGAPLRAGAFLMKAKEFAPKDLDNRYKLALVYVRVNQPQETFKEATEILKQAPDHGPALVLPRRDGRHSGASPGRGTGGGEIPTPGQPLFRSSQRSPGHAQARFAKS